MSTNNIYAGANTTLPGIEKSKSGSGIVSKGVLYVLLSILAVISFLPFYLMIINATHTTSELATKITLLPGTALLDNYNRMIKNVHIWTGFKNSIIISVGCVLLSGYFGALTAYGFAKFKFHGRNILFGMILGSLMIPSQLAMVGFFQVIVKLHMQNSLSALIIPSIANAATVFFTRYYVEYTVPDSVMESARMDGCGEFMIFNKIILPMIIPSVATMSIFTFIGSWNSFLVPMFVLTKESKYTMPLMTALSKGIYQTDYGAVYTTIFMSMVPILIAFAFCSKYIISGLVAGAVKE